MKELPLRARRSYLVVGLVLLGAVYSCHLRNSIGPYGDDADHVILAEALLQGTYRPIHLAEEPPTTHRPPLFPLLLTPIIAAAGRNYLLLKLPAFFSALLAAALGWWLFERRSRDFGVRPEIAAAALLPVVLSPLMMEFSTTVMTEMPFLALWMGFLCVLTRLRQESTEAPRWLVALSVILAVAMIEMRSIGLVMVAAAGIGLILEGVIAKRCPGQNGTAVEPTRARASNFLGALLLVVAVLLGALWRWMMSAGGVDYLDVIRRTDVHGTTQAAMGLSGYVSRMVSNLHYYLAQLPSWTLGAHRLWDLWPLGAAMLVVAAYGAYRSARAGRVVEVAVAAAYGLVLVVWVTRSGRFVIPMLPLLSLFVWEAVASLLRGVTAGERRRWVGRGIAALVVAGSLAGAAQFLQRPDPLRAPFWWQYRKLAELIQVKTPPDSIIACRKPALLYLWSERTVCWHPFDRDPDRALARLEELGATHLLRDTFPFTDTTRRFVDPLLAARPERFRKSAVAGSSVLYEFLPPREQEWSP